MAGKRRTLAVTLNITDNWIGGTYYILNIIRALNTVSDDIKPEIVILSPEPHAGHYVYQETGYPYLRFIRTVYPFYSLKGFLNRILNKLGMRKLFEKRISDKIDVLFPATKNIELGSATRKVFWIPDFQEHYYPNLFSEQELRQRQEYQKYIAFETTHLVLSSQDAFSDFRKIYPGYTCKVSVIPFAVTNPVVNENSIQAVLDRYDIDRPYFFIANQFWAHKNHSILLEAINILKQNSPDLLFVFSGKNSDYRSASHYEQLMQKVKDWQLEPNTRFLGFIDREDQLSLMKGSLAIIQPSLFEGWSTVVEDAKSMNKFIIVSDISVHKEQVQQYPHLMFQKNQPQDLAQKLKAAFETPPPPVQYDYQANIRQFGENLVRELLT